MTDITNSRWTGRVLYDGDCALCIGLARKFRRPLLRRGFTLDPLSDRDLSAAEEMIVEFRNGGRFGGADALVALARHVWWLSPLWLLAKLPAGMPVLRMAYRALASRRHCIGGTCRVARRQRPALDWLPLAALPVVVITLRNEFADWVFMWLLAFSIYSGCKWLTWRRVDKSRAGKLRSLAYLLAWPGMDAKDFFHRPSPHRVTALDWALAGTKTAIGAALLWLAIFGKGTDPPSFTAWSGMAGAILFLHFGVFHLVALGFNSAGITATPLMRRPALATSLADFWGRRWNTAFNKLVHEFAFRPLTRRAGPKAATLAVFLVSGVIHDLVISLPARGGYGKPTAYFVLQGAAVLCERSRIGAALHLSHGWRGRLLVFTVTCVPLPWLFHEPFVRNVVLPMLNAIGEWRGL